MLKYILRRIFQMVPTVLGVIFLTFILFNIVPNDLAAISLGKNVTPEMLERFDEIRGLNLPLFFGKKASTRAMNDQNFSKEIYDWRGDDITYNFNERFISVNFKNNFNPLLFKLNESYKYEWSGIARGNGVIAGSEFNSKNWINFKIISNSNDSEVFFGNIDFKKIKIRKIINNPFNSQLFFYFKQLSNADFGYSESFKQPVTKLLSDGIWPSLSLTIPIFFIGLFVSIFLSLVCALFRNKFIDRFFVILSVALMSINYVVYIVAGQYLLGFKMNIFPVWGYESLSYLFLPVLIGVISGLGSNIRFYRTIMLDEMYKDYVRTAYSKGASKFRVLFKHILKNASIPIITNVVIAIPFLYTGSLLLENFFGIPGLGYLGINAILSADIDVVRALVLIGSLLFVLSNLLTDICYALVDPRVKLR